MKTIIIKRDKNLTKIFQLPTETKLAKPKFSTNRQIILTMNNAVQGNTKLYRERRHELIIAMNVNKYQQKPKECPLK